MSRSTRLRPVPVVPAATSRPVLAVPNPAPVVRGLLLATSGVAAGLLLPELGAQDAAGALQLGANAAAVVLAVRLARHGSASGRRCWAALAAALGCWLWTGTLMALQPLLGFTVGDAGPVLHGPYLAGIVLTLLALALFPARRWAREDRLRSGLEAASLFACLLLLLHLVVLRHVLVGVSAPRAGMVVTYAAADLLLVVLAVDVARRTTARRRAVAVQLVGAMALWAAADGSLYTEMTGSAASSRLLSDALFIGGFGFTIGALLTARGAVARTAPDLTRRPWLPSPLLPSRVVELLSTHGLDLLMTAAAWGVLVVGPDSFVDWALAIVAGGLNGARQVLQASQASRARDLLEQRVEARTEELSELTSRQRRILDAVGEGIVGVDVEGRVSFVNPRTTELLGTTPERLLGADVCDVLCRPGHAHCEVQEMLALGGGVREGLEVSYRRGDGTLLPVEVNLAPKSDSRHPGRHGVVLAFRDVSVRRAVEQHKSQFISSVSHELRTPLTSIRGVLEVLADGDAGPLTSQAQDLVDTAERGVRRLGRLVDDIIDVERLAAGTFGVDPVATDLEGVVRDAIASLQPMAGPSGVRLEVEPMSVPLVRCDPDRVVQAIVNLVGNAVKFSPAGEAVTVSAAPSASSAREVVVSVRDRGRGIPETELAQVFERFHQVSTADADEKGGAGLGLTITRSIVERHGGRIWVESVPGEGSTFHFSLPVAAVPTTREPAREHAREQAWPTSRSTAPVAG